MPLLNNLKLQNIEEGINGISDEYRLDSDDIHLAEQVDETELDEFWNRVVKDIGKDSEQ